MWYMYIAHYMYMYMNVSVMIYYHPVYIQLEVNICYHMLLFIILQDYIGSLPNTDHPEAFGQHPNADIASQIRETRLIHLAS